MVGTIAPATTADAFGRWAPKNRGGHEAFSASCAPHNPSARDRSFDCGCDHTQKPKNTKQQKKTNHTGPNTAEGGVAFDFKRDRYQIFFFDTPAPRALAPKVRPPKIAAARMRLDRERGWLSTDPGDSAWVLDGQGSLIDPRVRGDRGPRWASSTPFLMEKPLALSFDVQVFMAPATSRVMPRQGP